MISFIIPVYNKGSVLYQTLKSLLAKLKQKSILEFEIILVNDGSTDNSLSEAIRFRKFNGDTDKFKIFHYPKNVGKGFALRFGFSKSSGDPVVFIDGDLDINTSYIIKAIKEYQARKPHVVIASKYHKLSRTSYPLKRVLYSIVLRAAIKLLFNLSVTDTQVGLKVFKREVLSEIFPKIIIKRFAVDLELLVVAQMYGYTHIYETPVVIKHIQKHLSSVTVWNVKNFCQDIFAIFYRKHVLKFYTNSTTKTPSFDVPLAVQSI